MTSPSTRPMNLPAQQQHHPSQQPDQQSQRSQPSQLAAQNYAPGRGLNNTQSPLSQPKRADNLWFDDGSVVLQVEMTQFRVHRSVLSTNSDIFRDMFSVPQPAEEGEVIDGCPVVHLPDSADDWTFVLQGLYDSRYAVLASGTRRSPHSTIGNAMPTMNHSH
jgi:hypothetical protein